MTTIELEGPIIKSTSNRGTVLKINAHDIKIGMEDGTVTTVPRTEMSAPEFNVDDVVEIYKDGREYILRPITTPATHTRKRPTHEYNKNFFVWFGAFFFGWLAIDRFMRGQIAIGILKIFIGPYTLFIWDLIDWLIAMSKAYGSSYADRSTLTFDKDGNYLR